MRKCFIMAFVAVIVMSQFAHARLFDRLRARRAQTTNAPAAATTDTSGKVTPAPQNVTPAKQPAGATRQRPSRPTIRPRRPRRNRLTRRPSSRL